MIAPVQLSDISAAFLLNCLLQRAEQILVNNYLSLTQWLEIDNDIHLTGRFCDFLQKLLALLTKFLCVYISTACTVCQDHESMRKNEKELVSGCHEDWEGLAWLNDMNPKETAFFFPTKEVDENTVLRHTLEMIKWGVRDKIPSP